jgi:NhaC family Na+:H+ antiporter
MAELINQNQTEGGRTPNLTYAIVVVGFMIVLILFSAVYFGADVAKGPLQVSLTLATIFAIFVAVRHGFRYALISKSIKSSVSGTLGTLFVVTAIGALIGSLYLSGTVAAVVYYGVTLLSPKFFYIIVFVIATLVSMVVGSAVTVVGMVGVAFVGLASAMGVSPAITAGAVVSGAIVGFTTTKAYASSAMGFNFKEVLRLWIPSLPVEVYSAR